MALLTLLLDGFAIESFSETSTPFGNPFAVSATAPVFGTRLMSKLIFTGISVGDAVKLVAIESNGVPDENGTNRINRKKWKSKSYFTPAMNCVSMGLNRLLGMADVGLSIDDVDGRDRFCIFSGLFRDCFDEVVKTIGDSFSWSANKNKIHPITGIKCKSK